ncbi:MAG: hypothetical protein KAW66_14095 [Candidatus Lokiarchaeota archaeon]|jgi:hypothetical protein|nr:hypothetical protein [Candidatus Lokiarchaeota archaeon]
MNKKSWNFYTHEYKPRFDYIFNSPNSDLALTALTRKIPMPEANTIYFYSMWTIIPEKGNSGFDNLLNYNIKDVFKVVSLTAKKRDYYLFTEIIKITEPLFHHGWEEKGYVALMGERKDGALRGYLLWTGDHPYVMGIWPSENRTRYEQTDNSELQNLLQSEIHDFKKPKLWKGVFIFLPQPKKKK